ncbi:MAG: hypothetical protein PWQ20_771 [Thermotogaceae bacterium]|jgi:flagellar motility protein MotE (MotC chaperone)|nr:hypothetical protein [Thermotogaceae bacterium]
MQVTLDQLLSVIMARLESMETMIEDLKLKENIALRLLSKKTGVTKEDLQEAVKEEFETMKKAGMIESEETETTESEKAMVEELYKWISGDVEELKKQIEEYKKKLKEVLEREQKGKVIDVAPPDLLQRLDQVKGKKGPGGLIIE